MSFLTYTHPPTDTDIVSISAIHLAVTVGTDHWHRTRPQPACLSVQLHLAPSSLNIAGQSDDVADSLHYGHLAKAVERRVSEKAEQEEGYPSARALVECVTDAAFAFVRDGHEDGMTVIRAVRVVLQLPKQILLAGVFEVELTTSASDWALGPMGPKAGSIVRVTNLVLPVLIGVNPPERLAKQRVITHITFFEACTTTVNVQTAREQEIQLDYPTIIQQIVADVEDSSYLTLEKLVYETIRTAYRATDAQPNSNPEGSRIRAITVRCQKPSALSFADASEVEMTRTRETL